jgi:hypothetical protein
MGAFDKPFDKLRTSDLDRGVRYGMAFDHRIINTLPKKNSPQIPQKFINSRCPISIYEFN